MRYLLPLILAAVLSSTTSAQFTVTGPCVNGKCPNTRVVPVQVVPQTKYHTYRVMERTVVRERVFTGDRRPVRRLYGRVFGFMGACR